MDSVCARALQLIEKRGEEGAKLGILLTQIICFEGHCHSADLARKVIVSLCSPEEVDEHLNQLSKMAKPFAFNLVGAKNQVAEILTEQGEYRI